MASSIELSDNLRTWYGDINRCIQKQEYDKIIKLAGRILHHAPKEVKAYQCRVVSFMLQEKFDEALAAIAKDKEKAETVPFEAAYCWYRLNRTEEVLATLRSLDTPDICSNELLAQVLYRLEEFDECYKTYKDLLKNTEGECDLERKTNVAATLASMHMWQSNGCIHDMSLLDEDTYEMCYNTACYLIGGKEFMKALEKLKNAEELLRLDTDLTEDEMEEDLTVVRVQMGYVLQRLGRTNEASQLYNLVHRNRSGDAGLGAVLSNNIVTINGELNVFDSKRKMKSATADTVLAKLTTSQRRTIAVNQCLLQMYSNQGELCLQQVEKLLQESPDLMTCVLIGAAQHVKDNNSERAISLLQSYGQQDPKTFLAMQLTQVQILLSQGRVCAACDALKALGDDRYRPGVVSALVALYSSQGDIVSASLVLVDAVHWYQAHDSNSPHLPVLALAAFRFHMKHNNPQQAANVLEDQRRRDPDNSVLVAQLISAYSQFDITKANEISRGLPLVSMATEGIDVDSLESIFSNFGPKHLKRVMKSDTSPGVVSEASQVKRKKKKKKGKPPKSNVAISDLDPERWLPRTERSYYRGKRKDRRKEIGKGTQGSGLVATELDASKPSASSGSVPSSPHSTNSNVPLIVATPAAAVAGPRQQKPTQAQKKKKRKGGVKW